MINKKLLEILACPECKKAVKYKKEKNILKCSGCGREYKIKDDIPIMLT